MKQEVKKLLILNLPYLLFVYLFDKIGAAIRLTPGADASEKLLQLGTGFAAAFSSIAPSLHPADLLIGVAGAVIIRLAVYMKGKNAKKYRKGMEYGSARWGGAEDIKPYIDPVFENNVLLTQTERLIPNIIIRKTKPLGHYGRLRKAYLEMHRPILFNELVLSDKLFEHCAEIDEAARSRMELIVRSLAEQNGVTEQLKAENQMEWVRQMNACKAQAEEVVKAELIYD